MLAVNNPGPKPNQTTLPRLFFSRPLELGSDKHMTFPAFLSHLQAVPEDKALSDQMTSPSSGLSFHTSSDEGEVTITEVMAGFEPEVGQGQPEAEASKPRDQDLAGKLTGSSFETTETLEDSSEVDLGDYDVIGAQDVDSASMEITQAATQQQQQQQEEEEEEGEFYSDEEVDLDDVQPHQRFEKEEQM